MEVIWFVAVAGGAIILGGAILYAQTKNRKETAGKPRGSLPPQD
jgi:hypothetical protein